MINKDTIAGTFFVALILCLVCSVFVSIAAVGLKDRQEANKVLDKRKNILIAASLLDNPAGADRAEVNRIFQERVTPRVLDIATGMYTDSIDAATFDQKKAAKDPSLSIAIPSGEDKAKIKRRSKYALVYEIKDSSGNFVMVVLPVHGKGLWSTMYGFLAVDKNGNTVNGLGFYSHAETPGLGGEIDNPNWKALWPGKELYKDGSVAIEVVKGHAPKGDLYKVDGISGATITARGVGHLVRYWVGKGGFEKYLNRLRGGLNG